MPPMPEPTQTPVPSPSSSAGGQPGILDGQLGRGDGVLGEEVHLPDLFPLDEGQGIEVPDLPGEAGREAGGVEPGDGPDAALPAEKGVPGLLRPGAERGDQPDAGDDDPPPGVPGNGE